MENTTNPPQSNTKVIDGGPRTPRGHTVFEDFSDLANKGDFEGLIDGYASEWGNRLSAKQKSMLIRQALKSHTQRGGTPAVIGALLDQILMFDAEFLLSMQYTIRRKMNADRFESDVSPGVIDDIAGDDLPKLTATEDRIMETCRAIASIKHTMALAEAPHKPASKHPRIIPMDRHAREAANG